MRNLRFHHPMPAQEVLAALEREGCLYHPGAAAGVLPINFNLDSGRQVTKEPGCCAWRRTPPPCSACVDWCEHAFHLKWQYDRD